MLIHSHSVFSSRMAIWNVLTLEPVLMYKIFIRHRFVGHILLGYPIRYTVRWGVVHICSYPHLWLDRISGKRLHITIWNISIFFMGKATNKWPCSSSQSVSLLEGKPGYLVVHPTDRKWVITPDISGLTPPSSLSRSVNKTTIVCRSHGSAGRARHRRTFSRTCWDAPKKRPDQKGGILMAQMMQNIECEFAELTLY